MKSSIFGLGCLLCITLLFPGFAGTTSLWADFVETESDFNSLAIQADLVTGEAPSEPRSASATTVITLTILPAPKGHPLYGYDGDQHSATLSDEELVEDSTILSDEREEVVIESEIAVPSQLLAE